MKLKEKAESRRLRVEEQLSLKDIANKLGVAKASVSKWVKDLPLPPDVMRGRNMKGCIRAGEVLHENARNKRTKYQQDGKSMAIKYSSDSLFVSGCMMHWSEGTKNKNTVRICNTDVDFLRLWIKFVMKFFKVDTSDFRLGIYCHLGNGKTEQEIEQYWTNQLGLPDRCITTTTLIKNPSTSSGAKVNKHPHGVAGLSIYSTEIVQQIWGAIKFFAKIDDNDRWVD